MQEVLPGKLFAQLRQNSAQGLLVVVPIGRLPYTGEDHGLLARWTGGLGSELSRLSVRECRHSGL